MVLELHLYDPAAGFDDDGTPAVINRTVTVNLPPPAVPNPCDQWTPEARAQTMADLLDAMGAAGRAAT